MWGCSPTSVEDARGDAQRRYDAARRRIEEGKLHDTSPGEFDPRSYLYGRSLLREELLEEIPGSRGATVAIRTRNRYGAEVLNAANALFIDVDLPEDSLGSRVIALFSGKPMALERRVLDRVRRALESVSGASFRVYRTAAGFRVLGTDRLYEPGAEAVVELMRAAGTDPEFMTLCRVQQCFRARLTPKPWRIDHPKPPTSFPFASGADEARMRRWRETYDAARERHAVCRFVEEVGPRRVHADMARVLELHDRATRAGDDLPLA